MKNKLHPKNSNQDARLRKLALLDHARRIVEENEQRFDRMFDRHPAVPSMADEAQEFDERKYIPSEEDWNNLPAF